MIEVELFRREETVVEGLDICPERPLEIGHDTEVRELTNVCLSVEDKSHMMGVRGRDGVRVVEATESLPELPFVSPILTSSCAIKAFTLKHRWRQELEYDD